MIPLPGAPLTKGVITMTIISHLVNPLLTSSATIPSFLAFFADQTFNSFTVFSLSLWLLYSTKTIERIYGTREYFALILYSLLLSHFYLLLLSHILPTLDTPLPSNAFPSSRKHTEYLASLRRGPYTLVSIILSIYCSKAPKIQPKLINILGIQLSDRGIFQLGWAAISLGTGGGNWKSVLLWSLMGALSPHIICSGVFWRKRVDVPDFIWGVGKMLLWPFIEAGDRTRVMARRQQGMMPGRQQGMMPGRQQGVMPGRQQGVMPGRQQNQQQPRFEQPPAPDPPSEEAISTLMGMGFDREDVIGALGTCDNNLEVAANRLLQG